MLIFGLETEVCASARIRAEILSLKGDGYRLKNHNLAAQPAETD